MRGCRPAAVVLVALLGLSGAAAIAPPVPAAGLPLDLAAWAAATTPSETLRLTAALAGHPPIPLAPPPALPLDDAVLAL